MKASERNPDREAAKLYDARHEPFDMRLSAWDLPRRGACVRSSARESGTRFAYDSPPARRGQQRVAGSAHGREQLRIEMLRNQWQALALLNKTCEEAFAFYMGFAPAIKEAGGWVYAAPKEVPDKAWADFRTFVEGLDHGT